MERGLSPNTLAAYRADLTALDRWLEGHEVELTSAKRGDLLAFMASRVQAGARPRSTARQLSSFRRFYRYLVREGSLREDPTAQIAMPKIGRSLPQSLTEEEVEALLAAPTVGDPLGHRDRTMLEVLYATGLRVSELVNLKLAAGQPEPGRAAHRRQGRSRAADPARRGGRCSGSQQFLQGPRVEILLERQTDYLFPTRRGDRMTRQAFWHIIKRYAKQGERRKGTVAAHAAPRFRHAPAESRRGPARRADAARPQRPLDDPDLHARRPRAPRRTCIRSITRGAEASPGHRARGSARLPRSRD